MRKILPAETVEEKNNEEDEQKNEGHFIPVPFDAVAPPQKGFQFFMTLAENKPRQDYHSKPDFKQEFPHTIILLPDAEITKPLRPKSERFCDRT